LFVCPIDEGDTLVVGVVFEDGWFVQRVVSDDVTVAVGQELMPGDRNRMIIDHLTPIVLTPIVYSFFYFYD